MPLSMIRGFQIEGQSDPEGYTVNDVYGLVGSCWKPAQLSDDIETDVKEDYALALQKARATDWRIEEQEAAEPVSLKSAARRRARHPRRWQHMGHRPWTSNMRPRTPARHPKLSPAHMTTIRKEAALWISTMRPS